MLGSRQDVQDTRLSPSSERSRAPCRAKRSEWTKTSARAGPPRFARRRSAEAVARVGGRPALPGLSRPGSTDPGRCIWVSCASTVVAMSAPTFRTIIEPFRIHSVEPLRMTTRDERQAALEAAGYNLFNAARRRRPDRSADRLRHRRHVAATSGPRSSTATRATPARRRGSRSSRRVQELFPFKHVIPTHQGRAAEKILFSVVRRPGQGRPEQHPLRHDPGERRVHRGARRSTSSSPEGRDPASDPPVQGQHGRRGAGARCSTSAAGRRPGRVRDDHQQLGRRPAGVAREPPRGPRGLRSPRRAAVPRRLPLRRERVVHPRARAGPGRTGRSPTSCARWRRSPTA